MSPEVIRNRLLKARHAELRRIVSELKSRPPLNAAELFEICAEIEREIWVQARRLKRALAPDDE